jgi:hypothetical protein
MPNIIFKFRYCSGEELSIQRKKLWRKLWRKTVEKIREKTREKIISATSPHSL